MIIRPATENDYKPWLEMRKSLWVYHTKMALNGEMKAIYKKTQSGERAVFLAEDGGEICGFIEVSEHEKAPGCRGPRIGFVEGWFVRESQRDKGVGRMLVEAAEAWARERGCTEMASDTDLRLYPTSPACHAALGYRVASIENGNDYHFHKNFYEGESTTPTSWEEPLYEISGRIEVEELVRLASEAGGRPEADHWQRALKNPYCYIVCRRGGQLCGFVRVVSDGASEGYIEDVLVAPTSRNLGIAKHMLSMLFVELKRAGVVRVSTMIDDGMEEFYLSQNFRAKLMGRLEL